MFSLQLSSRSGLLALDAGAAIEKRDRLTHTIGAAVASRVKDAGGGAVMAKHVAEPGNALFWRHDPARSAPRGAWGSWSFAMPARFSHGTAGEIAANLLPLETADARDDDFLPLGPRDAADQRRDVGFRWLTASFSPRPDAVLPDGTDAVALSTTGHGTREVVALPGGGPLVAAIGNPAGSRHVRNEFGRAEDGAASGPLHRLLRVVPIPVDPHASLVGGGRDDLFAPVLELARRGASGDILSPGGAFTDASVTVATGRRVVATLGASTGGPLHVGHPDDKHAIGEAADPAFAHSGRNIPDYVGGRDGALRWNMGALSSQAIFYRDKVRSAGLEFGVRLYDSAWQDVELVYDPASFHAAGGRQFEGLWRWQTPMVIRPAYPPAGAVNHVTNTVNNVFNFNFQNVVNNWFWRIVINIRLNPGPGKPIDPARLPTELALKSIYGAGIRRPGTQPYDGRFGGPPVDNGNRDGGSGVYPGAPRPDPVSVPPSGEGAAGGGGATTAAQPLLPFDPDFDPFAGQPPAGGFGPGVFTAEPDFDGLRREDDENRGAGAPWASAPLCWHIQSLAAIDDGGTPVATIRAGDMYLSATTAGVAYFCPPEAVVDLEANPPSVSLATFGLYDGYQGGSPARLAWGSPDHATGALWGGPYFAMSGSVGTGDLDLRYLDASGVARTGTLTSYGRLALPDGANSAGGLAWHFKDDTDTGAYRPESGAIALVSNGKEYVRVSDDTGAGANGLQLRGVSGAATRLRLFIADNSQWATIFLNGSGIVEHNYPNKWAAQNQGADGTVTAPHWSYSGDTDTGGYRLGANQLGWVAGGSLGAGSRGAVRLTTALFGPVAGELAIDLGALTAPWGDLYAADGNFTGDVSIDGKLTVAGVIDPTALDYEEQASNPVTTAAGHGQTWVRSDVPCALHWEDDAGFDSPVALADRSINVTDIGNVGGGEDNLRAYTVPGGILGTDNARIEWEAVFSLASATSRVRVKFGATTIYDSGTMTLASPAVLVARGSVLRTGATAQRAWSSSTGAVQAANYSTPGETLSGDVTLQCTGESTTASDNDIVQRMLRVRLVPAP